MGNTSQVNANSGAPNSARQDVVVVPADDLRDLVRDVLKAAGADHRNADRVAEALVSANRCGVETHGVWHLAGYVDAIKAADIIPTAWPASSRCIGAATWRF
jgi:LDH2 family malate/lactate/ureidoglycolate dehydrogenase